MKPLFAFALALNPLIVFAQVTATNDNTLVTGIATLNQNIPTAVPVVAMFGIGLVCELVMRIWPTKKPKSFLIMISSVLTGIGTVCTKLSALVDQVVQNVKDPVESVPTDETK